MEEFLKDFTGHLAAAIAGSIVVYVRRLWKDLNASFKKVRSLENRVKILEEKIDGT